MPEVLVNLPELPVKSKPALSRLWGQWETVLTYRWAQVAIWPSAPFGSNVLGRCRLCSLWAGTGDDREAASGGGG